MSKEKPYTISVIISPHARADSEESARKWADAQTRAEQRALEEKEAQFNKENAEELAEEQQPPRKTARTRKEQVSRTADKYCKPKR